MNSIEQSRSKFFPHSKNNAVEKSNVLKNVLKRNDGNKKVDIQNKTSGNVSIDISDAVKDFARIKNAVDSAPEIDNSQKIAHLRNQIAEGNYEIDYDSLADKIITSEF